MFNMTKLHPTFYKSGLAGDLGFINPWIFGGTIFFTYFNQSKSEFFSNVLIRHVYWMIFLSPGSTIWTGSLKDIKAWIRLCLADGFQS